jgi:hypothetical protein
MPAAAHALQSDSAMLVTFLLALAMHLTKVAYVASGMVLGQVVTVLVLAPAHRP